MKITKETEQFYLSRASKGILYVQLMEPINNHINVITIRETTFDKTLQGVFTKIKLYLDNIICVKIIDGYTLVKGISNDIKGAKEFIKYYRLYSYRKHLYGAGMSGDLRIT
jgi:hypothetical protein